MKRRLVAILMASVLAAGSVPALGGVTAFAENESTNSTESTMEKSGKCGYSAEWKLSSDGTLTISGSGDCYQTDIPWLNKWPYPTGKETNIEKLVVQEGITSLPSRACYQCDNLTTISLPSTLSSIPDDCFEECSAIERVSLPNNLQSIGNGAFAGCSKLKTIDIPNSVSRINEYAFQNCGILENVDLKNSKVQLIGFGAFQGCSNLKSVTLPDSLRGIQGATFEKCSNLSSIDIPDGVLSIGDRAFNGCSDLSQVSLPHTLQSIGTSAFSYCTKLNSITFRGSERQYNAINIESDNDALKKSAIKYEYKKVTGVTLPKSLTLPSLYSGANLEATVLPSDAADQYLEWSSSNPDIVKISVDRHDASVNIVGDKYGTARITAKSPDGNVSASCEVTVVDPSNSSANDEASVYFDLRGGKIGNDSYYQTTVKKGSKVTEPTHPTRNGYTFLGWSMDYDSQSSYYDFSTPVNENLTLHAIWQKNDVETHIRTNNGENEIVKTIGRNDKLQKPNQPTRKGYTFKEWEITLSKDSADGELEFPYDFSKTIGQNITTINAEAEKQGNTHILISDWLYLEAQWEPIDVKVTYHLNGVGGKDVLTTKMIKYDGYPDREIYPAVPGYAFLGWYTDKECTKPAVDWSKVDKSVDLYAGWMKFADYSTTSTEEKAPTVNIYNTTIGVPNTVHGTTTVTPSSDGKTATITTKPDAGYEVNAVRVTDADGKDISVKKNGDGTYTFTVPDKKTAVVTTYKKKGADVTDQKSSEEQIKDLQKEIDDLKQQVNTLKNGSKDTSDDNKSVKIVTMSRLYNPNTGEHFYTGNVTERNYLVKAGWKYEGAGWNAPSKSKTPVYRLYNPNAGDHHYTKSVGERNALIKLGWKNEGIAWYSADQNGKPVYRLYNPNTKTGTHTYTVNPSERQLLMKLGWKSEGIAWRAE